MKWLEDPNPNPYFQGKVSEAMKWLEDEREARSYLHTLANKMHEELDSMKTATIRVGSVWECVGV